MVIVDKNFDRRCRRILEKHGLRMHKENDGNESFYWLYEIGVDDSRPDDNDLNRWFNADGLLNFCAELDEEEAERQHRTSFYK